MISSDLSLKHIVRPSRLKEMPPVLVLLHGYGSHENDLFSFAPALDDRYLIVSAQAPLPMQPYGFAWYSIGYDPVHGKFTNDEQALHARDLILKFVDEVIEFYGGNPADVTLMGFSQGAILSYAVALSYPEKIRRVVAMSGYIDEDLLKAGYEEKDFSHIKFYGSHGSADEVVPVEWDRRTKPFLEGLGIENTYSEFPVGHGVSNENFEEILRWLNE